MYVRDNAKKELQVRLLLPACLCHYLLLKYASASLLQSSLRARAAMCAHGCNQQHRSRATHHHTRPGPVRAAAGARRRGLDHGGPPV